MGQQWCQVHLSFRTACSAAVAVAVAGAYVGMKLQTLTTSKIELKVPVMLAQPVDGQREWPGTTRQLRQ